MKKYLLSLLVIGLSFIGFSNAENFTPGGDGYYSPSTVSIPEGFVPSINNVLSYDCPTLDCGIEFDLNEDGEHFFGYSYSNEFGRQLICQAGEGDGECYFDLPAGSYHVFEFDYPMFSSIDLSFDVSSGGGDNGGGTGGNNVVGGIINGGITTFTPIIKKLGSILGEFGPYIIYIAIACLGISLLFKALKYILGFTNNSAKNSIGGRAGMKERRTQRRRLRRMKNKGYKYRYNEFINEGINPKTAKEQANYMVKNRDRIGKKYGYRR